MNKIDESYFLEYFNKSLIDLENELEKLIPPKEYPNIFILGVPRSGTTLISQVLYNHLDIGCTNNLIARFWECPLVGAYLSKIVIGDRCSYSYKSDYGRTNEIDTPHEFSFFWREFLKYTNPFDYDPQIEIKNINWNGLKKKIIGLNNILNKPFVFKTLEYTSFYLGKFNQIFPNSIFISIKRDAFELAKSIYLARIKNGNVNNWWSSVPLEYNELKNMPFEEQIAGQIFYLDKLNNEAAGKIDKNHIYEIDYKELLNDPSTFIDELVNKIYTISNYKIKINSYPDKLEKINKTIPREILSILMKGLEKFNLK